MFWIVVLICLSACEWDDKSPRVPFKLHPPTTTQGDNAPKDPADLGPSAFDFDKPLDHPPIDGLASPFVAVRSLLSVDLDGDQDRDAIAVVDDAAQVLSLAVAMRDGAAFAPATSIPGFGLAPGCELTRATLQALSASKGVLSVQSQCGEPKVPQPQRELLFAIDPRPFLLEQVELSAPSDPSSASLALKFTSEDADADTHEDVVLHASLMQGTTPLDDVRVVLFDRGPSLAFDAAGFEAELAKRAELAKGLLRKTPDQAAVGANVVIALSNALCRGAEPALLSIAGKSGLPCAASPALARARATAIAAQADQGQLAAALDGYIALSLLDPKLSKQPLADATRALSNLKPRADVALSPGPAVEDASASVTRLPAARFITDALLYVRRTPAVVFDVEHGNEAPAPTADDRITDPAGALYVSAIERHCAGLFLRIDRVVDPAEQPAPSAAVSAPLIVASGAAKGCVDTPELRRKDAGGLRLLGWAPQGVLAARGSEVLLVPLAVDGKPAGEPRTLDATTPRPAPVAPGRASADASRHVWVTPFGVAVFGPGGSPELWRPKGWEELASSASDAAISPSGRRIAVIAKGRVHILSAGPASTVSP